MAAKQGSLSWIDQPMHARYRPRDSPLMCSICNNLRIHYIEIKFLASSLRCRNIIERPSVRDVDRKIRNPSEYLMRRVGKKGATVISRNGKN